MTTVFVSYSRRDIASAHKLVAALLECELETWIDWEDIPPTADWKDKIKEGIESSDGFLFLLSPDSIQSKVCREECDLAVRNGKRLILVVVRDVEPDQVHPALAKINWIYCREQDDFEKAVKKLISAVRTDLEWVEFHRQLQVKALEWERGLDQSLLLRGKELQETEKNLAASAQKDPQPTDLQRQFLLASRTAETRSRNRLLLVGGIVIILLLFASIVALNQSNNATHQANTAIAANHTSVAANSTSVAESNARATAQVIAEQQRQQALSRQLAAQAGNTISIQPDLALLLSLESHNAADTFESRDAILKALLHEPHLAGMIHFDSPPVRLALSRDEEQLAVGQQDGTLEIWKTGTLEKVAYLRSDPGQFRSLFFDEASRVVYAVPCTPLDDFDSLCRFLIWDLKGGAHKLLSPADSHWPAAFSLDGTLLAFTTTAGLQVWDVSRDVPVGPPIPAPEGLLPSTLAFSPDRSLLLAGTCRGPATIFCEGGVIVGWKIANRGSDSVPDMVVLGEQGFSVVSLAFDGRANQLASGSCIEFIAPMSICPGGEIKIWRLEETSDRSLRLIQLGATEFTPAGPVTHLAFASAIQGLYTTRSMLAANAGDDQVYLYREPESIKPGNPWVDSSFSASRENIAAIDLSLTGRLLAAAGGNTVTLWERDPASVLQKTMKTDTNWVTDAAFTKDGSLVVGGSQGNLSSLDPRSGRLENLGVSTTGFGDVVFSPAGDPFQLVYNEDGKSFFLVDPRTRQHFSPPLTGSVDRGTLGAMPDGDMTFSADGDYFAFSNSEKVVLWDLKSAGLQQALTTLPLEASTGALSLAFSPDGKTLAAGEESGGITIWSVPGGKVTARIYPGASTPVGALAFTPDGRILAAAVCTRYFSAYEAASVCEQSEIRLWDVKTHQPFGAPLLSAQDIIRTILFDRTGGQLFVFPFNRSEYQVWDLKLSNWLDYACQSVGRNFTRAEWNLYFQGTDYRRTCPQYPAGQ